MKFKPSPLRTTTKQPDPTPSPFLFVLKEGREIQHNFLDYKLMLFQTKVQETIPSQFGKQKTGNPLVQLLIR